MKYIKYVSILLLIVSAILAVIFYGSGYSDSMVTTIINWSIILSCVALAVAVFLPLFFSDGKSKKGMIVQVGLIVILCVVSYLCANGTAVEGSRVEATEATWKYTDAGLILTGILFVIAVAAIFLGSFISKVYNK